MKRVTTSIYRNARDLGRAYERMAAETAVGTENQALITQFVNTWIAKGFTQARGVKLVYCMRRLARLLGKPFAQATKEDLIALVGRLEGEPLNERSRYDVKVVLKTFYRWYKGGDEETVPREVSWLKPRFKNNQHKLPEELLTEDEVLRMAGAATKPRDKALILVLYESGCRIGELLSLQVKHVSFDQYGAVLRVTGKTGDRRVRIISSAPALSTWLEFYEGANDPNAFLWPPRSNRNTCTDFPAVHASICKTIDVLAERAGIKKNVHPHLFRHSRATALASKLTEAQMKEYFGWTQSSDMASVYVHLSGRDVDRALLALQGMAKPEDKIEEKMLVCLCLRCKEKNSPAAKFCLRCGSPMNATFSAQMDEERKTSNQAFDALMQNPEFKDFLLKKVGELGLEKQIA